jgi:hypothetical protein
VQVAGQKKTLITMKAQGTADTVCSNHTILLVLCDRAFGVEFNMCVKTGV